MDIFIEASAENAKAVYRALADFGAPLENICPEDFGKRYSVVRIEVPPIAINILQHIDGVEFEQAGWIAANTTSTEFPLDISQLKTSSQTSSPLEHRKTWLTWPQSGEPSS